MQDAAYRNFSAIDLESMTILPKRRPILREQRIPLSVTGNFLDFLDRSDPIGRSERLTGSAVHP